MARYDNSDRQGAFARAVANLLRESRRRQGLTQSQLADATGGLVSKAALANYETGLRSLRIDVFWVLAKALGEDAGVILASADRGSGLAARALVEPIVIDIHAITASSDPRLEPVRRWFALRRKRSTGRQPPRTMTLDSGALTALAQLMGVTVEQCRDMLESASEPPDAGAGSGVAIDHSGTPGPAVTATA